MVWVAREELGAFCLECALQLNVVLEVLVMEIYRKTENVGVNRNDLEDSKKYLDGNHRSRFALQLAHDIMDVVQGYRGNAGLYIAILRIRPDLEGVILVALTFKQHIQEDVCVHKDSLLHGSPYFPMSSSASKSL